MITIFGPPSRKRLGYEKTSSIAAGIGNHAQPPRLAA